MAAKKKAKPYAAQQRYVQNQIDDGLVRVTTWVHPDKRDKLLKYAKKLRGEN